MKVDVLVLHTEHLVAGVMLGTKKKFGSFTNIKPAPPVSENFKNIRPDPLSVLEN